MKIERERLLRHLTRVHCDDMIPEAVFSGAFETAAIAPDNTLIVEIGALEGAEPLDGAVGFNLKLLTDAMTVDQADVAEVSVGGNNRLLAVVGRVSLALVTTDPENTTTRVPDQMLEGLREDVKGEGHPLDAEAARTFLRLQRLLKATEVRAVVGPQSGLRVGRGTEDQGQVALPGVEVPQDEAFHVTVAAPALSAVLNAVGPEARMWFGEHAVTVRDGVYSYHLAVIQDEE